MISRRAQLGALAVCMGIGAYGVWAGISLRIGSLGNPQAGLMPFIAGAALVGFALLEAWRTIARQTDVEAASPAGRPGLRGPLVAAAILFLYAATLNRVGFAVSTFFMLALLTGGVGRVPWRHAVVLAVTVTAVCYGLFKHLLGVPLP